MHTVALRPRGKLLQGRLEGTRGKFERTWCPYHRVWVGNREVYSPVDRFPFLYIPIYFRPFIFVGLYCILSTKKRVPMGHGSFRGAVGVCVRDYNGRNDGDSSHDGIPNIIATTPSW